ncbi:IS110 family transposase [Kocuria nitroreducens]|uniref:IS110 family transposase n=1 Tax=Kocuria nitroreducens TaxID=3058914 RepID=UPI0036DAC83C
MTIVAEHYDYVVGVDTHARTHTYTALAAGTGAVLDTAVFPTTTTGTTRAISWIRRRTTNGDVLAAVEGTSSYGARLTCALLAEDIPVAEVRPPNRNARAMHGKSDAIDAQAATRSVLGQEVGQLIEPRAAGARTALRVLLAARLLMDHQRTANRNALTALLRGIDLGIDARRPLKDAQIATIAAWRTVPHAQADVVVARAEAKRLAIAIRAGTEQLAANRTSLQTLAEELAPGLQETPGIGPVTAAIIVCAYSHHGRIRSEAAFAALAGVAPRPASSGNTTRHRLNRSGDRQLNRAFETIVRTRISFDPVTRDYVARARATGKSSREIRRNLKRYVARSVFRQLQAIMG